jgi:hypothetical protein
MPPDDELRDALGARVLMATLADQTTPTHPDELPLKFKV